MVESDYPHADSSWPDTQAVLDATWGTLPDDELRAGGRRQCEPALPSPAPVGRRLAYPRAVTGRGDLPLPPRAGPIVDADGHVVEPASAWAALPDRYRPRISADGGATSAWSSATPKCWPCRPAPSPVPATRTRGPAARHGRRGHRPGRAVPDHRPVPLPGGGLGRRGGPRRRRKRLAGRVLQRRSAPASSGRPRSLCRTRWPRRASSDVPSVSSAGGGVRSPQPRPRPLARRPRL